MEFKSKFIWVFFVACLLLASSNVFAITYDSKKAYRAWITISKVEYKEGIPQGLLHSISLVETGKGLKGNILPWPYTIGLNSPGYQQVSVKNELLKKLKYYKKIGFAQFDLKIDDKLYQKLSAEEIYVISEKSKEEDFIEVELKPRHISKRFSNKQLAKKFANNLVENNYENFDIGIMQINWRYHKSGFSSVEEALDVYRNANYAVSYLRKNRKNNTWWQTVGRYHSKTPKHAKRYIKSVWNMYKRIHNLKS